MSVSFIATVYNEGATINELLQSLSVQSRLPDEIIIVDGGSTDNTLPVISNFKFPIPEKNVKIILKKGNRAAGRNAAVKNASNEIIVCSDAGCILDKDWLKNIITPLEHLAVDVIAGYYKGNAKNIFQKCLVPYVLVMPDKVNENNFLPASRSIAFRKSIWKKIGGFSENFGNNEDYVFARRLKEAGANIVFEKKAIVYWMPRKNLKDSLTMFYRFAKGDAESRILRPKVILLFSRYIIALLLIIFCAGSKSYLMFSALCIILFAYILWAVFKNYKYVKDLRAVILLPLIQITSDIAVMLGTISGLLSARLKIMIEGLIYLSAIYSIILLNFRKMRSLFGPPKITENEIVGYAHYFGYPLYFETIIFFIFICSPIVVFFILSKIRKYKS